MKKREIRKFIVMIMGIILLVSEVQLFSGDNVYASTKTSRYEQLYVPSYAAMSGKMLYYAVGSGAQGGRLYMYNTSTKRQKKISDLRCTDLTITKKNIYCTVNKYIGSDARNRYVYRMSKDGKKTKVLAEGYSPVVVGKNMALRAYIEWIPTEETRSAFIDSVGRFQQISSLLEKIGSYLLEVILSHMQ